MSYKKQEIVADFSDKIAISKMAKDAEAEMEKAEAMKFNVFLKKCIPTKSGTDKEKFGEWKWNETKVDIRVDASNHDGEDVKDILRISLKYGGVGQFGQMAGVTWEITANVMRTWFDHEPKFTEKEYNAEIGKIMESELIKLGLLDKHEVRKQDPKNPLFRQYFMHGTSHYLGLDVHDVGDFDWPMKEGMVFTCEPGIYILEEELGIRLENNVLITSNGPDDLMKNIPIETEEIEDLMNS